MKVTTNTLTTQSELVNCMLDGVYGQSLGFHSFIANFIGGSDSVDLTLSVISSHNLGAKNDNDSVPLYTNFTGLV